MVAPVLEWQDQLTSLLRQRSALLASSLYYVFGLIVLPVVLVGTATALCRWPGLPKASRLEVATRFSYALVPLGFSMWLAHYSFHFLASFDAVIPVLQRLAGDLGWAVLGKPAWAPLAAGQSRIGSLGWKSCFSIWGCYSRCIPVFGSHRIDLSVHQKP